MSEAETLRAKAERMRNRARDLYELGEMTAQECNAVIQLAANLERKAKEVDGRGNT